MTQREQVAITARVFSLAAIFGLALVAGDPGVIQALVAVSAVAGMSVYVGFLSPQMDPWATTAETLVVGLVMGLSFPESVILLPYLVVLPFIAGLARGLLGAVLTVAAEVVAVILVPLASAGLSGAGERVTALAPWLLTTLGAGLLGVWAKQTRRGPAHNDRDASYESARRLLNQLRTVARHLSAGLDAAGMSAQLLAQVHTSLDDNRSAVFVKTDGSMLVPLGYRGQGAQDVLLPNDPLIDQCWSEMEPVSSVTPSGVSSDRHRTALPLRVGARMVGVVIASASRPFPAESVEALMEELDEHSLRIDTALTFDEIRTMATTDERQRLAREIHDGIAQEVASLGYLVDDLAATTSEPGVADGLRGLRAELSRVVADLRLSIFDLRSDVSAHPGLGAALSEYVRQVGAKSKMTVHLSLDEAPTRLTPVVESELFRIAQEAITNARKHAAARNLWVDCRTDPPSAQLSIRDDGRGINGSRDDSYGITIMRERARRIGAALEIGSAPLQDGSIGTLVQVKVSD